MPLPKDILEEISGKIAESEASIKNVEDVIADLRATGIDASKQEASLATTKQSLRTLKLFYERQVKRGG